MTQLSKVDVKVCLHGHVHESYADLLNHYDRKRRLYIVGAGSFGATAQHRPESTPRLYNLIEIDKGLDHIRVNTRCLRKVGGAWEPWAVWPGETEDVKRAYYDMEI